MRIVIQFIIKEFLQLFRDKKLLPILFISPILQLIIFGYAANLDIENIKLAFYDEDRSPFSRELISHFTNSRYFTVTDYLDTFDDVARVLDYGQDKVVIIIPQGFGRDLSGGKRVSVPIMVDGTDNNSAGISLAYASGILGQFSANVTVEYLKHLNSLRPLPPYVEADVLVWYNQDLKSRDFVVPGIMVLILMILTMLLTSLAIVKEKEIGTLEQLSVTPIRPSQLVLGKLIPFSLIGIVNVIVVILITVFWFDVPLKGSALLLMGMSLLYLLSTLGLGLFVSTVSDNQQQAMMICVFFLMLPMIFISGFIFPIENMPQVVQWITYLSPLRYFFVIVRGIFLKGIGVVELLPQIYLLAIFGVSILTISILRFKKRTS